MTGYTILNSRKRVIVALVHSIFFLAVAMAGLFTTVAPLGAESHAGAWGIAGIYVTVSAILGWLTAIAAPGGERAYFAFCTTSASFGLARQVLGDPAMHAAVYVRIAMLGCAVVMGVWMLRREPAMEAEREN